MQEIERFKGPSIGRSRASAFRDLVYTVATVPDPETQIAEQTRETLKQIEENLAEAGSHKTRILSATVYLADMADKETMDTVWNDWIGAPENWPQRACVQVGLAPDTLIEVVAIGIRDGDAN